jgi:hypothetical protein
MGSARWPQRSMEIPDASQNARGSQQPSIRGLSNHAQPADAEWRKLIDILAEIEGDLGQSNEISKTTLQRVTRAAREATLVTRDLWSQANRGGTPLETRIEKTIERTIEKTIQQTIEKRLRGIEKLLQSPQGSIASSKPTYASVVSQSSRGSTTFLEERPTIRIRIPEEGDKTREEILAITRKHIPDAFAVRRLRSGDTEVQMQDQLAKDKALNREQPEDFTILRSDYPVEIPGVPLDLRIACGKNADNAELIRAICAGSKPILPNLAINDIRWLHSEKQQANSRRSGKTRGTVILHLATQEMQHEAVRKGIVIQAEFFETRLYHSGLQIKQCFNCSAWGHTQSACGKQAKCGECAGAHQSRDCPKERVACANCGRAHRSWQKGSCKVFTAYKESIEAKRTVLLHRSLGIRSNPARPLSPVIQNDGFKIVQNKKRGRSPATALVTQQKRGPGRPSFTEIAARDRAQSTLSFNKGNANAPQEGSDEEEDVNMSGTEPSRS